MFDFMKDRFAVLAILIALFLGAILGSTITYLTIGDAGPPLSCIERGGVVVIESSSAVKCVVQ